MTLRERLLSCISDDTVEFGIAIRHLERGEETMIDAETVFPTASVFKVPLMVEVYKQARAGKFKLEDRLELAGRHKTLTSGVLVNLADGLRPTIRDLLMLMTIVSDNTATTMLMELVGPQNATASMHALGLSSMEINMTVHQMFLHAFGVADQPDITLEALRERARSVPMDYQSRTFSRGRDNNVSSPADMTKLMTMIFEGRVVDRAACDDMLVILGQQQLNTRIPRFLPGHTVRHKTGTMRGLRNDSGIIYCGEDSHVAFTVFSFDAVELPLSKPRLGVERTLLVEQIMGEMGAVIYEYYQA